MVWVQMRCIRKHQKRPSDPAIQSVLITEDCVRNGTEPQVTRDEAHPRQPIKNAGITL